MSDSVNFVIECILRAMQKRTGDVGVGRGRED